MRIVLQKVSEGLVDVVDEVSGEVDATFEPQRIGVGYVLLVGVEDEDGTKQVDWLARKIANLRVFEDENGKMNRSIHDVDGSVLSISQFTLYADVRKGNRPSFVKAGAPRPCRTGMACVQRRVARAGTRRQRRQIRRPHARKPYQRWSGHHHFRHRRARHLNRAAYLMG